ncbi:MAG: HAD-IIIA family hydrolase [Micropepsaceae bacterium]
MVEQAVFLVGGLGTRLGELTRETPKPMLPVGGRPFLDYLVENARRHGLKKIVLLCGFRADVIEKHFAGDPDVAIVYEPAPAGTGGALAYAADILDDRFFLLNGDTLFDFNLLSLVPAFQGLATLALRAQAPGRRSGWVALEEGRVKAFHGPETGPGGPINAGVYLMSKDVLGRIGTPPVSLEGAIFPALAAEGALGAYVADGYFIDIGVPDDFARAQTEVPARRRRPAVFFDRDGVINVDTGYPHRPDQIEWMPGAAEAIRMANEAGYYTFVVTNQAGVARGYYSEDDVRALHGWMNRELQKAGAHIDRFEYCPSHPDGTVAAYTRADRRRKPNPGMLLDLMRDFPVDARASFLIGDRDGDLQAAAAAGVKGHLYQGGSLAGFIRPLIGAAS